MYSFVNFTQGATFAQCLYCLLLYCFLLLFSLRGNVSNLFIKADLKGGRIFLFCGLLLFALTAFVGADFFHYYEFMSEYRGQVFGDQELGLESFYQYLINYIDGNYFIFRLVVWGGSLALIVTATRLFGANVYHTLFVILAGFIVTYSYARATLAMSVFSLGIVIICTANKHKKGIIKTIIGIAIVACSIYFHRSMLPMIVVAACWLLLPCKKQLSRYSLLLFPIIVVIVSNILKIVFAEVIDMVGMIDDESGFLQKTEYYVEQETVDVNTNGIIRLVFHYANFYLPFLILGKVFSEKTALQNISSECVKLYQIVYLIYAFATSFLFLGVGSSVFFDRYLYMSFIPLSILITYMKDSGVLSNKRYLWIVTCFILCNFLQLFAYVYAER